MGARYRGRRIAVTFSGSAAPIGAAFTNAPRTYYETTRNHKSFCNTQDKAAASRRTPRPTGTIPHSLNTTNKETIMKSTIQRRIEAIQRGETPKGYKKTKWGTIPDNWKVKPLGEIASFCSGGTPNRDIPDYFGGTIPWIKSGELNRDIITETEECITDLGLSNSSAKIIPAGTILIAMYGATAGVIAITNISAAINQAILAVTPTIPISVFFLFNSLKRIMVSAVNKYTQGGQPNFNSTIIKKLTMPFPPLREQEAIAEILTHQDRLIVLLQKLIDEKRRQKKYLMQTLLTGRIRLPGFKDKWKTKTLGEIADINKGVQINKSTLAKSGLYYVLNGGVVPSGYCNSWNVEANTISISEGGNSCGFVNFNKCRFWSGGHCYTLQNIATTIIQSFLYHYLKFKELDLMRLRVGSGLPNIQKNRLSKVIVPLPSLPEQEAIAEVFSTADEELSLLERELEQEKLRKKALMQLLLTGLVRVEEL